MEKRDKRRNEGEKGRGRRAQKDGYTQRWAKCVGEGHLRVTGVEGTELLREENSG